MTDRGRAASICVELEPLLQAAITSDRALVRRIWLPRFDSKYLESLNKPLVTIRPSSKPTRSLRRRDSVIEIGVTARLPQLATLETDETNQLNELDAIDLLAEEVADMFTYFDPDELPEGSTKGTFQQTILAGHIPTGVEINTLVDVESLASQRQFVSIILVTYQFSD